MISAQSLIDCFRLALSEKWGYIWGTSGEIWSVEKQRALEKTTDPDRAQGRMYGSRWIGRKVADCSGLFTWAFRRLGGTMYHGSNTMYLKWCADKGSLKAGKRTDGRPLKPGTAVFVWNGSSYSHVGLYVGGGTVIEAMGTIAGVTTTRVTMNKWSHWGELTGVDYAEAREEGNASRQTVRKGDKGEAVRACQQLLEKLGYSLGPCGADGDFGRATETAVRAFQAGRGLETDGICGPATWAALEKAAGSPGRYAVRITGLDKTQAAALQRNYPGSVILEEEGGEA